MILYFLEMFQWIQKYFCILNQEIRSFIFKEYPNRFLYLHTFLRKIPWKLFDPFITFKLQMWRMNYLYISKYFSIFLWSIFENITGMLLHGHLLAARTNYISTADRFFFWSSECNKINWKFRQNSMELFHFWISIFAAKSYGSTGLI